MIFDRYILKDLGIATIFISLILAVIIFLTQSLRFLELVIDSGASATAFWILTLLAMPRFFEIILPIAVLAATLFVYNRMATDSELTVMRATGSAPLRLARPALALSAAAAAVIVLMTTWLSPAALVGMQSLKAEIKAQYATFLFREGVFSPVGDGLTVFVRDRGPSGELRGILIHDTRAKGEPPVTVLARRGALVSTRNGQQVVVYDGSRQSLNAKTGALNRLDFERYTISLPEGSGPVRERWREPEERTFMELLNPDPSEDLSEKSRREFRAELHRRLLSPLLAPLFALMSLAILFGGSLDRRGQSLRIAAAVAGATAIEGLFLVTFDMARHSSFAMVSMYIVVLAPAALCLYSLSPVCEGRSLPDCLRGRKP